MKQNYKVVFLLVVIMIFLLVNGCTTNEDIEADCLDSETCSVQEPIISHKTNIEKLEIFHFHGTNQCYSCKTVGAYAEETVKTYFADELESGKIVFDHINGELPENREKVIQYGATGSSLWLGVYDDTGFHAEQNTNVWYKINDKQAYMDYLKGVIEKRLEGDMS